MGKGKKWTPEESADLAASYIHASEDAGSGDVKGTNQDADTFWTKVLLHFSQLSPPHPRGIYHDRAKTAIINHWKEYISRDVKKFNNALLRVMSSRPTGVNQQEIVNMAVAIHRGKIDCASYRHRDHNPNDWHNYKSWLILKGHRAFLPPQAAAQENTKLIDLLTSMRIVVSPMFKFSSSLS